MDLIELFKKMWADNPSSAALASTFLLGSVSSLLVIFRNSIKGAFDYLISLFITSFTISSDNKYFYILMNYLKRKNCLKKFRRFRVFSNVSFGNNYDKQFEENDRASFSIGNSTMFVIINKRFYRVSINTRTLQNDPTIILDLSFSTFGRTHKPYENLMKNALKFHKNCEKEKYDKNNWKDLTKEIINPLYKVHNFMSCKDSTYNDSSSKLLFKNKSFDNIFMDTEVKNKLIDRIEKFLNSRRFYDEHQIPYHFGLLMYGQPGTGKSSIIKALINKFDFKNVYYLNADDITKIGRYNRKKSMENFNIFHNRYINSVTEEIFEEDLDNWTFDKIGLENQGFGNHNTPFFRIRYSSNEVPTLFQGRKDFLDKSNYSVELLEELYNRAYESVYYKSDRNNSVSIIIIEDIDTELVSKRRFEEPETFDDMLNYFYEIEETVPNSSNELYEFPFIKAYIKYIKSTIKFSLKIKDCDPEENWSDWKDRVWFTFNNHIHALCFDTYSEDGGLLRFKVPYRELQNFYNGEYKKILENNKEELTSYKIETHKNNGDLSTILNSLDGLLASEDYIIIATTNYIDSIDPAILRPGRFDYKIEICAANLDTYKQFCKKFYPDDIISDNIDIKHNSTIALMQEAALSGMQYKDFERRFTRSISEDKK